MVAGRRDRTKGFSTLVCPGCGKAYDIKVSTIEAEMFCDRCRLETVVIIKPRGYVGKDKSREGASPKVHQDHHNYTT